MVAHADAKSGRIVLISIPRDLYYKGRKVNSIYETFGAGELMREMSSITGLPITKYIIIDMYAFADVVNIVGGIDVYLPTALVDPTYRVRNDGVWSTLYYSKGWHHLDGIETLRVARSRHTTSDFARALRQQEILGAIRQKVESLDVGNVGKIYDLIRVLLHYVSTNFTPLELLDYYTQYQESPLEEQNVLDMTNVLYQSYSNVYYLKGSKERLAADTNKGEWILLPKNNDWNVIRWYVRKIIEGEGQ